MNYVSAIFAAAGAALMAACATTAETPDTANAAAAEPDPRLGAEASSICFPRSINGWSTIDGDDDAIILTRGVNDRYRVEYSGACSSSDFRFAQKIGIGNRPGGGCLTRGDFLLVEGPGDFVNRCFITKINEWDEDATDDASEDEPET